MMPVLQEVVQEFRREFPTAQAIEAGEVQYVRRQGVAPIDELMAIVCKKMFVASASPPPVRRTKTPVFSRCEVDDVQQVEHDAAAYVLSTVFSSTDS